ncbi:hypothetical protein N656DRAFT_801185 [Canariomyces notabilis]|uniref:Uncharacterized protein n=1 Tax=Canariomyces notabilis TaxID=2074819 RepID=A0AAN6QF27_9PEZI|nr:hypothetical protein N656DRAFT_801185 [Canariomyces arenarius]
MSRSVILNHSGWDTIDLKDTLSPPLYSTFLHELLTNLYEEKPAGPAQNEAPSTTKSFTNTNFGTNPPLPPIYRNLSRTSVPTPYTYDYDHDYDDDSEYYHDYCHHQAFTTPYQNYGYHASVHAHVHVHTVHSAASSGKENLNNSSNMMNEPCYYETLDFEDYLHPKHPNHHATQSPSSHAPAPFPTQPPPYYSSTTCPPYSQYHHHHHHHHHQRHSGDTEKQLASRLVEAYRTIAPKPPKALQMDLEKGLPEEFNSEFGIARREPERSRGLGAVFNVIRTFFLAMLVTFVLLAMRRVAGKWGRAGCGESWLCGRSLLGDHSTPLMGMLDATAGSRGRE